jgi:hypothetical protein
LEEDLGVFVVDVLVLDGLEIDLVLDVIIDIEKAEGNFI